MGMTKSPVSIVRLDNYRPDDVAAALGKCLGLLGGLPSIIRPQSRVFVKINHLSPATPPERGIITHPVLAGEVLRLLKNMNCDVTVGDDIQSSAADGFVISGYRKICRALGVRLVNLKEAGFRKVALEGSRLKAVYISPLCLDADFIIDLAKLKTHSLTVFTGAVKNMFGVIPHGLRINCHRQFSQSDQFSEMLVDIFSCVRPHLTVMDGVVAMEGEGPAAGRCRTTGVVVAGRDGIAVDAVSSAIIGFNPLNIFTTSDAYRRGLGQGQLSQIEIRGETLDSVRVEDFEHSAVALGLLRRKIPSRLFSFIYNYLALTPVVVAGRCTGCQECIGICPAAAAQNRDGKAWLDQTACIHCMCCHEVCRFGAIRARKRVLGRVIHRAEALWKAVRSGRPG
jgi:uncharacterized protein (DUF362 family)/Pyruvate/2-oxoacid:ferredoxin oxidoreductase delta subunit